MKKFYALLGLAFIGASVSAERMVVPTRGGIDGKAVIASKDMPALLKAESSASGSLFVPGVSGKVLGSSMSRVAKADATQKWETIFEEDFSRFELGTEEEIDAEDLTGGGMDYIPSEYTALPNWWGVGVYQAGGVCALQYPYRGGVIASPRMNMTGKVKLSFSAKSVDGTAMLIVSFAKGTESNPGKVSDPYIINIDSSEGWKDVEWVFENFETDDCFIQFNAMTFNYGVHLDNIKLERDTEYIERPHVLGAAAFRTDGFRSEWNAINDASSYGLILYGDVPTGTPKQEFSFDFNSPDSGYGEGVEGNLAMVPTADGGAEGSRALLFTSDDDYVIFPDNGGMISEASFFMARREGMEEWNPVMLGISGLTPEGVWVDGGYFYAAYCDPEGNYVDLDPSLLGRFVQLKFSGKYMEEETDGVVLDDVRYVCEAPTERRLLQEGVNTADNWYEWCDLDPMTEYYFSVSAKTSKGESDESEVFHAFGVAAPEVLPATDLDKESGAFTACWNSVPKATSYICDLYRVFVAPEKIDEYPVLSDDFSGVEVETTMNDPVHLSNIEYVSLDRYTAIPGWYGSGTILADGMIGCQTAYGYDLDILTPLLTLSNNDGSYDVEVTAWCEEGEMFVVQGLYDYKAFVFAETGFATMRFTLNDGGEQQRLMIYTADNTRFWLDDFKVIQPLEKGDRLLYSLDSAETDELNLSVADPNRNEDDRYAYSVTSVYKRFNETCLSDPSEFQYVDFDTTEVVAVGEEGNSVMAVAGGVIIRVAAQTEVSVFSIDGRVECRQAVEAGNCFIPLASGVHVVSIGDAKVKVMVK